MKKKQYSILLFICLIILLPTLYFPVSTDQAVFIMGGKTLANGQKLYVDYIDLKPPLIFDIYAAGGLVFGTSEYAFRIMDIILQLITIASIIYTFKKLGLRNYIIFSVPILYCFTYFVYGFHCTAVNESYLALGLVWLLYFHIKSMESNLITLWRGLSLGFIISLKYTFGLLALPLLIDDIINSKHRSHIMIRVSYTLLGSLFIILMSHRLLFDSETWEGFVNIIKYLSYYSSYQQITIKIVLIWLKIILLYFFSNYGFLYCVICLFGVYSIFKSYKVKTRTRKLFDIYSCIIFAILLITVIIERKIFPNHISRLVLPLAVMASLGIEFFMIKLKYYFAGKKINSYRVAILTIILIITLFIPLLKWSNYIKTINSYYTSPKEYDKLYPYRSQMKGIAAIIRNTGPYKGKLIVSTVGSTPIYILSGHENISRFAQSQYYFSIGVPKKWLDDFIYEISHADLLVIQKDDRLPQVNGHKLSSWESFNRNNDIMNILKSEYVLYKEVESFLLFRKKQNGK